MGDPPPFSDPRDDTDTESGRESRSGTPLWVKVFGIIILALVLLVVIVLVTGGHGPGRHASSGDLGGDTSPIQQEMQLGGSDGDTPPKEHEA